MHDIQLHLKCACRLYDMARVGESEATPCIQDMVKRILLYLGHVSVCCVEAAAEPMMYVCTKAYVGWWK